MKSFALDRDRTYEQKISSKPNGLWLSVDDDWRRWVEGEEMKWLEGAPSVKVTLAADAKVLVIGSVPELDDFNDEYGVCRFNSSEEFLKENPAWRFRMDAVRWNDVAALYQGVFITPYLWPRRLSETVSWYWGWDCASGCVWDLSAIHTVEPLA